MRFIYLILLLFPLFEISASDNKRCGLAKEISNSCSESQGVSYIKEIGTLCINGFIDADLFDELSKIKLVESNEHLRVYIRSDGGVVNNSIDIVELLTPYDVFIDGNCVSACAQFIFVGAVNKYIIKNGVVAMHGGPIPKVNILKLVDISEENIQLLIAENERFEQFYDDRFISIDLLTSPPESVQKRIDAGELVFWMPKMAEFEKNGVHNISYCDSEFGK